MGHKHGTGLPDRLCSGATPTVSPNPPHYSSEQTSLIQEAAQEEGDPTLETPCGSRSLVQHFPSSQEGQRAGTGLPKSI